MVIQLTVGELALLQQAALGRRGEETRIRLAHHADLALLLDMQLVVEAEGGLQITLIGQHILKHARNDPPRI